MNNRNKLLSIKSKYETMKYEANPRRQIVLDTTKHYGTKALSGIKTTGKTVSSNIKELSNNTRQILNQDNIRKIINIIIGIIVILLSLSLGLNFKTISDELKSVMKSLLYCCLVILFIMVGITYILPEDLLLTQIIILILIMLI